VARVSANLLQQKKAFKFLYEKSSSLTGLVWNTNMAVFSYFWNTNMSAEKSCENAEPSVPSWMGACAFTNVQHRGVIVFKNLRFHPSTQEQQNGVFKNLLSIEFLKRCVFGDRFLRIPVDGTPIRNKIYPFSNKKGYVWTEPIVFTLSCSLPDSHHTTNNKRPNPTVGTREEQNDVH